MDSSAPDSSPLSDVPSDFDSSSGFETMPSWQSKPRSAAGQQETAANVEQYEASESNSRDPARDDNLTGSSILVDTFNSGSATNGGAIVTTAGAEQHTADDDTRVSGLDSQPTAVSNPANTIETGSDLRLGAPAPPSSTAPATDGDPIPARTARRRVAPTRLEDQYISPSKKPTEKPRSTKPTRGAIWSTDYLLRSPKSRLAKIDLMTLLCDDSAWTHLSREQQGKLLSAIPGAPQIEDQCEELVPNIARQLLKSNTAFQADVRMFQEDLVEGRLDPEWQKKAQIAMEMRARGDFDDWKQKNLEEFWGQKQKLQYSVLAGDSSKIKLEALIYAGCFMVDDVWTYCHIFRKGGNAITVEKEAKIVSVSQGELTFSFPPKQFKFSSPAARQDVQTGAIASPHSLATALIKEDGRVTDFRIANAWKEFRCIRNNQDIGSPWEIRETYHQRRCT